MVLVNVDKRRLKLTFAFTFLKKDQLSMTAEGRRWQHFGERKNGHKNFCQACICYFRDKCVVSESKLFGEGPRRLRANSATLIKS